MRLREVAHFSVEECPLCDGLWLEDQVPEKLVTTVASPQFFFEPVSFERARTVPEGKLSCPCCSLLLQVFEVRGVPVDVCMQCRGLWLDGFELRKILTD